ncbi:tetratricopeptide repeat protein [Actinosynnema mirum]|nr:tetratricopeptide repeat protein [Actinosynnema mirum]
MRHRGARTITEEALGMTTVDEAVERGWANADPDDPEPTVEHFRALLAEHPDDVVALFEYAGSLDYAGHEAEAAPAYERAFAAGLDGDRLRQGLIQYGSTLRNLGRHDEAIAALERADREFPGHDSVRAFLALALTSAGRAPEAVALLLALAVDRVPSPDLQRYQRALRGYAAELTTTPNTD